MDPLAMLGKLFRKKEAPLSPGEMAERASNYRYYLDWSRGKRILVFDPPFWGFHDMFVDQDLNHSVLCLKHDGSAFAFHGDERGASMMEKFGPGPEKTSEEVLEPGMIEWRVYDDYIIYNGPFFPIARSPLYFGKVVASFPFEKTIALEWTLPAIKDLFGWYERQGKSHK